VTIRTFLVSRFRKLMFTGILAWPSCAAAGFSASAGLVPEWIVFIPFIGFFTVVLLTLFWIRCPCCNGPLGKNAGFLNCKNRIYQRRVNFCPYCGVSFDDPFDKVLTIGSSDRGSASWLDQGGSR
jgi:hypothetical protein